MPDAAELVFVHGWSVHHTNTYGGLPERLLAEAARSGVTLHRRDVFLGRYVSFHDEVRVRDIARAMEAAVRDQNLGARRPFYCVTHSTGGPVVREWYRRFYASARKRCPMSHLVMLAPANFGSALAQLGKSHVGRVKSWFEDIEPGQGVLDWLELGSPESFALNEDWIRTGGRHLGAGGYFPFVITGQWIDRKFYDNVNSYTGELGSDGVVRVAAANLNATYVRLKQTGAVDDKGFNTLRMMEAVTGPAMAWRLARRRSHSGSDFGIMRSVRASAGGDSPQNADTVQAILRCFAVSGAAEYRKLAQAFAQENEAIQREEKVETERKVFVRDRVFIRDRCSQLVFRILDSEGIPLNDFDLLLTAGPRSSPDDLPQGFFRDRQRNTRHRGTITYFINYDVMMGAPALPEGGRAELPGAEQLGLELHPRPEQGFVRYRKCRISAKAGTLSRLVRPDQTTLVDIEIDRLVSKETFRLERTLKQASFKDVKPGDEIAP